MIREEIQIVRRRLDDYSSYKVLAQEADRNALETQVLIDTAGMPQSPKWGSTPVETHIDLSSRINELISDQMSFEKDAKCYRKKLAAIEDYIQDTYDGEVQGVMKLHYLQGIPFDEMEDMLGITASGLKMMVYRAMEASDFSKAQSLF